MRTLIRLLLISFFGLFLSPGVVFAEVTAPTQGEASGPIPALSIQEVKSDGQSTMERAGLSPKTLANGLYMSGSWSASWVGSVASVTVTNIYNDSYTRTSGTLRLEMWAVNSLPGRAQAFNGYRLAVFGTLSPLGTRQHYSNVTRTGTMLYPPDGTYWLLLVLTEYDSVNCSLPESFCMQDSAPSSTRETFGSAPVANYGNFSDLWWNSSESGWGISITHHSSGIAFIAWYTYDDFGNPKWYVASSCRIASNYCSDTLYETIGPPFGPTFNPSAVSVRNAGTISLTFTSLNSGRMTYNVRGSSGTKSISRQPF